MLTWSPKGRVFPTPGIHLPWWVGGYGALPFAVPTDDGHARVFFSGRDAQNRAHIGACELDLRSITVDPSTVTSDPLVTPGPPGAFDESGCTMSCIVRDGDRWLLYYTGWTLGRTIPFYLAVGCALSDDGGRTFRKHSLGPILDRNAVDPFLTASPCVLREGALWRMWYVSATKWEVTPQGPIHHYLIKYAESSDGLTWSRDGGIAIPFQTGEYAMGRPHVIHAGGVYRMWFCVRGDAYRLAYAESADGLTWTRMAVSEPARSDWDGEMQAYPMTIHAEDRTILLYNGNGYGATGFGCAVATSI